MLAEHIKTKSWQLLKEKGLCSTVPTCQSTHASALHGCLFSTPSLHVSAWTDLLLCCGTLLTSQNFCLLSALELDQITSVVVVFFFYSPTRRLFAYGLILFSFSTCLFLISRMEEDELLKERFQAITVSACNSLY